MAVDNFDMNPFIPEYVTYYKLIKGDMSVFPPAGKEMYNNYVSKLDVIEEQLDEIRKSKPDAHTKMCPQQNYCLNGGQCYVLETLGTKFCKCGKGFTGRRCQVKEPLIFTDTPIAARRNAQQFDRTMTISCIIIGALVLAALCITAYCMAKHKRDKFYRKKAERERQKAAANGTYQKVPKEEAPQQQAPLMVQTLTPVPPATPEPKPVKAMGIQTEPELFPLMPQVQGATVESELPQTRTAAPPYDSADSGHRRSNHSRSNSTSGNNYSTYDGRKNSSDRHSSDRRNSTDRHSERNSDRHGEKHGSSNGDRRGSEHRHGSSGERRGSRQSQSGERQSDRHSDHHGDRHSERHHGDRHGSERHRGDQYGDRDHHSERHGDRRGSSTNGGGGERRSSRHGDHQGERERHGSTTSGGGQPQYEGSPPGSIDRLSYAAAGGSVSGSEPGQTQARSRPTGVSASAERLDQQPTRPRTSNPRLVNAVVENPDGSAEVGSSSNRTQPPASRTQSAHAGFEQMPGLQRVRRTDSNGSGGTSRSSPHHPHQSNMSRTASRGSRGSKRSLELGEHSDYESSQPAIGGSDLEVNMESEVDMRGLDTASGDELANGPVSRALNNRNNHNKAGSNAHTNATTTGEGEEEELETSESETSSSEGGQEAVLFEKLKHNPQMARSKSSQSRTSQGSLHWDEYGNNTNSTSSPGFATVQQQYNAFSNPYAANDGDIIDNKYAKNHAYQNHRKSRPNHHMMQDGLINNTHLVTDPDPDATPV